jgi:hypothetical protein
VFYGNCYCDCPLTTWFVDCIIIFLSKWYFSVSLFGELLVYDSFFSFESTSYNHPAPFLQVGDMIYLIRICIYCILCTRKLDTFCKYTGKWNCLLKHVTERKIRDRTEVTGRRWRRCKHLLGHLEETRGYWKFTEEVSDHNLGRTLFGKVYWPAVRQNE